MSETADAPATLLETKKFFGMNMADFNRDWKVLDQKSRDELRKGIGDGSLNY